MYCNTTEITHIRVTRMMVDINGKRNMRTFIIHRESSIENPLEDGCCAMPLLPGTIMSRLLNRHHQFDINLTSKTGCNGWAASGHRSSRQVWMKPGKTPPEEPQFRMAAVPLFHHLARKHTMMSRFQQAPPSWHGDRLQRMRQHTPVPPWSLLKHATADESNVSGVCSILLAHHKTWTSSCTQLPPSTCMRKPPL